MTTATTSMKKNECGMGIDVTAPPVRSETMSVRPVVSYSRSGKLTPNGKPAVASAV